MNKLVNLKIKHLILVVLVAWIPVLVGWSTGINSVVYLDASGNVVCDAPFQYTALGVNKAPSSYDGSIECNEIAMGTKSSNGIQGYFSTSGSGVCAVWSAAYVKSTEGWFNDIIDKTGTGAPTFTYGLTGPAGGPLKLIAGDAAYGVDLCTSDGTAKQSVGSTGYTTFAHPITLPNASPIEPPANQAMLGWNDGERDLEIMDDADTAGDVFSY